MTFPPLVYAKDSLIISIDGGGFLDLDKVEPDTGLNPEKSRHYLTNQIKNF